MLNPPISPIDLSAGYRDVSALLTILADPVQHKARLDELIAREAAAQASIKELHDMEAETRRLNSSAQARNIVVGNREKELDAREAALDERAEQLSKSESTRSDAALRRREDAVFSRENINKVEAERLAAVRKDYEAKLAKLTAILETQAAS
jgi:hypothetical protein